MSCFIINKKDYMKVAGVIAYWYTKDGNGNNVFQTWDSKNPEMIQKEFIKLYENNVKNYCLHYGEKISSDKNNYDNDLLNAYKLARKVHYESKEKELKLFKIIYKFLRSIRYQSCDNKTCCNNFDKIGKQYLDLIATAALLDDSIAGGWSNLDIIDTL